MLAIQAERATKVSRTQWRRRAGRALNDVSFSVEEGSAVGLLGPNGAGKTTIVKSLLAATWATSDVTRILGRNAGEANARRPVGYLPENHRFPAYLTGAGMLDLYGPPSGVEAAERPVERWMPVWSSAAFGAAILAMALGFFLRRDC
jgi:ABC-2 type transport system ATP-binding protein